MKFLIYAVFCSAFCILSCTKPANQSVTRDYLDCYVDGVYFKAGGSQLFTTYLSASYNRQTNILNITGEDDIQQAILSIKRPLGSTSFQSNINGDSAGNDALYSNFNKYLNYSYVTDSTHCGLINVTIDTINKRVTGTFSFKAKYQLNSDTVSISKGEFSLPYN